MTMITIGIVGGTGYSGVELLRLLAQHPAADVRVITSRKEAGTKVAEISKRWFRVRDTYGIEIAAGTDEIVVLAVAVAVDAMADRAD